MTTTLDELNDDEPGLPVLTLNLNFTGAASRINTHIFSFSGPIREAR
jgi:hypothetical protein